MWHIGQWKPLARAWAEAACENVGTETEELETLPTLPRIPSSSPTWLCRQKAIARSWRRASTSSMTATPCFATRDSISQGRKRITTVDLRDLVILPDFDRDSSTSCLSTWI